MRKTFQKWLFLSIALAFVFEFTLTYFFQTRQGRGNAISLMRMKIEDTKEQIRVNDENMRCVRDIVTGDSLAKTRAFAEMIRLDPTLLTDEARLHEAAVQLDVDELHVSDAKGILIASIPRETVGYDMASNAQSAEFMPAISDKSFAYVQELRPRGVDGALFEYAGVARTDQEGIVQIGYQPHRLIEAMKVVDLENIATGFRIGREGRIVICRDDKIVSIDDKNWLDKPIADYGISPELFNGQSGDFECHLEGDPPQALDNSELEKLRLRRYSGKALCLFERFNEYVILGILPKNEMYLNRDSAIREIILFNFLLFCVVFFLVSGLVQRVVIRGIRRVNDSLEKITAGDLDEKVNVRANAEFSSLSDGVNTMVAALKDAIAETAARIDKELEFARGIQLASIPNLFPPFPDRDEFDLYATMQTAREVGGDFYDFMLIDDDHLFVLIADVSGKGIPAALYMMTSKTTIKNFARTGASCAEILTRSNDQLCEHNDSAMFVTVFVGVLEISTGVFTCASGGHNPPVLMKKDGSASYLHADGGIMIGGMEGVPYGQSEIQLEPGDRIYFYTDGVTEAFNESEKLFGEERLLQTLENREITEQTSDALLRSVRQEILRFTGAAVQSDDITMMLLTYFGETKVG